MLLPILFLMDIPSMAISPIPSYQSIGYWATVLLVTVCFLQGMAVGGGWGSAVLMAVEHAPKGSKGFFGSLPQTGGGFGLILSSIAMAAVTALPEFDLFAWGWCVPFLSSIVLISWVIRVRVPESPDLEHIRKMSQPVKASVHELLRRWPRELLLIIGARTAKNTWFYLVVAFALSYAANQLKIPKAEIPHVITAMDVVSLVTMPFYGWFSDQIAQQRLFLIGLVVIGAFAALFFSTLEMLNPAMMWWAIVPRYGRCVFRAVCTGIATLRVTVSQSCYRLPVGLAEESHR